MDEISLAIGKLTAAVEASNARVDAAHAENIARWDEALASIADIRAQIHDLKHGEANLRVEVVALAAKVDGHQQNDSRDHAILMERLDDAKSAAAKIDSRLSELFAIRYRMLGGFAVIAFLLAIFGHSLWQAAAHLWYGMGK